MGLSDLCFFAAVETSATRSRSMADCVDAEDCSCGSKMAPAEPILLQQTMLCLLQLRRKKQWRMKLLWCNLVH